MGHFDRSAQREVEKSAVPSPPQKTPLKNRPGSANALPHTVLVRITAQRIGIPQAVSSPQKLTALHPLVAVAVMVHIAGRHLLPLRADARLVGLKGRLLRLCHSSHLLARGNLRYGIRARNWSNHGLHLLPLTSVPTANP